MFPHSQQWLFLIGLSQKSSFSIQLRNRQMVRPNFSKSFTIIFFLFRPNFKMLIGWVNPRSHLIQHIPIAQDYDFPAAVPLIFELTF